MRKGNRAGRREAIVALIQKYSIATQMELRERLKEVGIEVTQATLSRDVRELRLGKAACEDFGMRYVLPPGQSLPGTETLPHDAVTGADYAGHIAVIHCCAGTAGAVCVMLDAQHNPAIVGTIAGDDTVFVLMRTPSGAKAFSQEWNRQNEQEE